MSYKNLLEDITREYEDSGLFKLPENLDHIEKTIVSEYVTLYSNMKNRGATVAGRQELLYVVAKEMDLFSE